MSEAISDKFAVAPSGVTHDASRGAAKPSKTAGAKRSAAHRSTLPFGAYLKRTWQLYAMIIPAMVIVAIFSYGPMWGIQLAFRDYSFSKGIAGGRIDAGRQAGPVAGRRLRHRDRRRVWRGERRYAHWSGHSGCGAHTRHRPGPVRRHAGHRRMGDRVYGSGWRGGLAACGGCEACRDSDGRNGRDHRPQRGPLCGVPSGVHAVHRQPHRSRRGDDRPCAARRRGRGHGDRRRGEHPAARRRHRIVGRLHVLRQCRCRRFQDRRVPHLACGRSVQRFVSTAAHYGGPRPTRHQPGDP